MKHNNRILFLLLLVSILFGAQSTSSVNALAAQSLQNDESQSNEDKLKEVIDSAKELLFWDMQNFPGTDRNRPKILSYPPTMLEIPKILNRMSEIEYKKLSKGDYVDFMLLSHYLYSLFEENKILKQHENNPQIYLVPLRSISFRYSEKIDIRRIYNALNQLPNLSRYYEAARKCLKSPYDVYLNQAIESMKYLLSFLNKTLTFSLIDNIDKIRIESWQNVLYKSIKDAEKFLEYLHSLQEKAVKLSDKEKQLRNNIEILHKLKYKHLIPETPRQLLQFANEEFDEEVLHMRQLLKTKLVDMDLSVRALNCLKAADVDTLGDLVTYNRNDLLKFRNFGKKSLTELDDLLDNMGLNFGMDITKYKLDKD